MLKSKGRELWPTGPTDSFPRLSTQVWPMLDFVVSVTGPAEYERCPRCARAGLCVLYFDVAISEHGVGDLSANQRDRNLLSCLLSRGCTWGPLAVSLQLLDIYREVLAWRRREGAPSHLGLAVRLASGSTVSSVSWGHLSLGTRSLLMCFVHPENQGPC